MAPFNLDDNDLYVACSILTNPAGAFPGSVRVYKLKNKVKDYMLLDDDWEPSPVTVNPTTTSGRNALVVNGSNVNVRQLAQHLCMSRLRVNRLGYCFYEIPQIGPLAARTGRIDPNDPTKNFTFYRMNDLWNWAPYGAMVDAKAGHPRMRWDRLDILRGTPILFNLQSIEQELETTKTDLVTARGRVTALESENQDLRDDKQELQDEIDKLKEQLRRSSQQGSRGGVGTRIGGVGTSYSAITRIPESPSVFDIRRGSNYAPNIYTYFTLRSTTQARGPYTPTNDPLPPSQGILYTIFLTRQYPSSFDTNNWYRYSVQGSFVLAYEGSLFYTTVGSSGSVAAPMDPDVPHLYNHNPNSNVTSPLYTRPISLFPIILTGVGPRFCLALL